MLRLKSIGVMSAAKISGLLYAALSLLFVPILLIAGATMTFLPKAENQPPAALFIVLAVLAPVLYGAMGFVAGAFAAFAYNLVAGWIGGLELQFEGSFSAPAVAPPQMPPQF
jgi:hypothetical protein